MRRLCVMWWSYALCCRAFLSAMRPHCARFRPSRLIGSKALPEAIRAVQARRLAPPEAVQLVTMRLRQQLRNQVRIVE